MNVRNTPTAPDPRQVQRNYATQQRPHPRRSPPRESISLPHNKKQKLTHPPEQRQAIPNLASQLHKPEHRSQESGSDQSASGWFDRVNKHAVSNRRAETGSDVEPPFFMTNQHNYIPNECTTSGESSKVFGVHSRFDSENEDLRGVIDDLTVENKRLKHILRSHQSRRNTPASGEEEEDKLFEVRMHGLPPDKRRELKYLLRNFATSIHTAAPSLSHSTSNSGASSSSLLGKYQKTDSGYASASNSGQTTLAQCNAARQLPGISSASRDNNIKNYLHDIPDTLLPRQNPVVMTDRAKMALVVRRLENLFTGKTAAPGEHSQPQQQQEVSQLAAKADANARSNQLRKLEGSREAHILPLDSKANFDTVDVVPQKRSSSTLKASESSDGSIPDSGTSSLSRPGSPDQRPTRPLDLDIHRAQVAAENIQYIRHLGMSSPRLDWSRDPKESSWIYLNLLINMAQLHTINVTPEFIRRAIKKMSMKFELSKDGHRVRWLGGPEGTVFSKEEERALEAVDNADPAAHDSTDDAVNSGSSKRSKTDSASNAVVSSRPSDDKTSEMQTTNGSKQQVLTDSTSKQQSSLQTSRTRPYSTFDYKPVVYREKHRELEEISYLQDEDSSYDSLSHESSGLAQALSKSNLNKQRGAEEGPITFYNNPYFCSDYSGDKNPSNITQTKRAVEGEVIGMPNPEKLGEGALRCSSACYYAPQFGPVPFNSTQESGPLSFEPAPLSAAGEEETLPMDLLVSGLGGVTPDDNFAIDVKVELNKVDTNAHSMVQRTVPHTGRAIRPRYAHKVTDARKISLLPSRLPPASYVFFMSSSSSGNPAGDEDTEDESDETSSSADDDCPAPPAFLQHWSAETSGDNLDSDDGHTSSSVDMLAEARAADPERIAEQERQYMITQPGTRVIAGSLAATAGASQSASSVRAIESDMSAHGSEMDTDEE